MVDSVGDIKSFGQPSGIGGWLILPTIGTCLAPFFYLKGLGDLVTVVGGPNFSLAALPLKAFVWIEFIVNFGIMCAWGYAIYALFSKKRVYPGLFISLAIISIIIVMLDIGIAGAGFNVAMTHEDYAGLAKQFISALIWVPYMAKSQRVRNTFIQP